MNHFIDLISTFGSPASQIEPEVRYHTAFIYEQDLEPSWRLYVLTDDENQACINNADNCPQPVAVSNPKGQEREFIPYNAEMYLCKPWGPKGHFEFEIIIN